MEYTKPPLSIDEQLSILQNRGLVIGDIPSAKNQLAKIGYFRFVNYLHPLESDKKNHVFKPNSSFDKALNLYYFDKELRSLLFSAIQTVEIALRSKIMHSIAMKHGAFWFSDTALFVDKSLAEKNLSVIRSEVSRSKEDFILNHYRKYDTPDLPPVCRNCLNISILIGLIRRETYLRKSIPRYAVWHIFKTGFSRTISSCNTSSLCCQPTPISTPVPWAFPTTGKNSRCGSKEVITFLCRSKVT